MKLSISQTECISVIAREYYSQSFIEVVAGESYSFRAANWPLWVDLFIPCNAAGFYNPILFKSKKRVQRAKCFELCGAFDGKDDQHFIIGKHLDNYQATQDGHIHFFANDHINEKYYKNNSGYINLSITRLA